MRLDSLRRCKPDQVRGSAGDRTLSTLDPHADAEALPCRAHHDSRPRRPGANVHYMRWARSRQRSTRGSVNRTRCWLRWRIGLRFRQGQPSLMG